MEEEKRKAEIEERKNKEVFVIKHIILGIFKVLNERKNI